VVAVEEKLIVVNLIQEELEERVVEVQVVKEHNQVLV
jgi:hypothetical protein